jgi:hypothetical protein
MGTVFFTQDNYMTLTKGMIVFTTSESWDPVKKVVATAPESFLKILRPPLMETLQKDLHWRIYVYVPGVIKVSSAGKIDQNAYHKIVKVILGSD